MPKASDQNMQQVTCTKAGSAVLSSRWYLCKSRYEQRNGNKLTLYFSGQEVFAAIAKSIKEAKQSIDIVCWGFDPAMPIVREGDNWKWKEADSYGHHLTEAANADADIEIRLLIWHTGVGNWIQDNVVGVSGVSVKGRSVEANDYAHNWYKDIANNRYPNIKVVFRQIKDQGPLDDEDDRSIMESLFLGVATDHQKALIVDYGGDNAHGYVMGQNSLTAYWDTVEMRHDEPLREVGEAGETPYHDFSIGIKGSALIDLNANFCESWNDNCEKRSITKKPYDKIAYNEQKKQKMEALCYPTGSSVQLVRTRPDKELNGSKELEIRRAYLQVAANPRRYVLIVNQYLQYPRWVRELKKWYVKNRKWLEEQGSTVKSTLYVFAFTCEPENSGMMFRTHQMANELGVSDQVEKMDQKLYHQNEDGSYRRTVWGWLNGATAKQTRQQLADMGIETVFCNLKTQVDGVTPKDIYIHAKLMVIDDDFFTLGSANLNFRSMAVDSELNLLCDDERMAYQFRKTLFERYSGGVFEQPEKHKIMDQYFKAFKELTKENQEKMKNTAMITGHAVPFSDKRSSLIIRVA